MTSKPIPPRAAATNNNAEVKSVAAASANSKKKKRDKDIEADEARKKREYEEQQAAWRPITWAEYNPDLRWPLQTVSDDIDLGENDDDEIITASPHGSLQFSFSQLLLTKSTPTRHQADENDSKFIQIPQSIARSARQCVYDRILTSIHSTPTPATPATNQKYFSFDWEKFITENNSTAKRTFSEQETNLLSNYPLPACTRACDYIAARADSKQYDLIGPPVRDAPNWNPVRSYAGYLLKNKQHQ